MRFDLIKILFVFAAISPVVKAETVNLTQIGCTESLSLKYITSCEPVMDGSGNFTAVLTPLGVAAEREAERNTIIVTSRRSVRTTPLEVNPVFLDDAIIEIATPDFSALSDLVGPLPLLTDPNVITQENSDTPNPSREVRGYDPNNNANAGTTPSTATTGAQVISSQDIASRYETLCRPVLETTQRCCQHPEQCLSGDGGGSQNSAILGTLQAIMGSAGQAASISGACGKMKNLALTSTAINAALAGKCTSKISQCKTACGQVVQEARAMYQECQRTSGVCSVSQRAELNRIASASNSCEANESFAQQQANQTIASGLTAKTMDLCKKAATSTPAVPSNVALNQLNINCADPASASNPACQNACNRAGAQNDPACNPALGGGFGGGFNSDLVNPNGKSGLASGSLDEIENSQDVLSENIAPTGSKVSSSTPGGSANLAGGGGDDGGGPTPRGARADGEDGGYDINRVSAGVRTGSGYISASGRSVASVSSGGYYVPGRDSGKDPDGKPFNPKDYLPGGRLDPKRRLAGLGSTSPAIGAVHGDIFKNITNRFYQVCLRDGLMDCETLRKSSKLND